MKKVYIMFLCVVLLCACGRKDYNTDIESASSVSTESVESVQSVEPTEEPTEEPVVIELKDPESGDVQAHVTVDLQPLVDSLKDVESVEDLHTQISNELANWGLPRELKDTIEIDSFTPKSDTQEALVHIANSDIMMVYYESLQSWNIGNQYGSDWYCILFDEFPEEYYRKGLYNFLCEDASIDKLPWFMTAEYTGVGTILYNSGEIVGTVIYDGHDWTWYPEE